MVGLMNDCWTGRMAGTISVKRAGWVTVKAIGWVTVYSIDEMVGSSAGKIAVVAAVKRAGLMVGDQVH